MRCNHYFTAACVFISVAIVFESFDLTFLIICCICHITNGRSVIRRIRPTGWAKKVTPNILHIK